MSRIQIKFVDLHNPLFFNGNLGTKIDSRNRAGMVLQYDTDLGALIMEYQRAFCVIPSTNICSMNVTNPEELGLEHTPVTSMPAAVQARPIIQATAPVHAQVSTPGMRAPSAMSPAVPVPQPRSAQVSHPARDAVDGVKLSSPPKYLPHTQMALDQAQRVALSGTVHPGAPAPTHADLVAAGKLAAPVSAETPARKSRARKAPTQPKIGE